MPKVDLTAAYDLHIHSNPSLFERSGSDLDMARHARDCGLTGILLKNHFESTVGRAALAAEIVPEVKVYGSLVLNRFAGGLNPVAVEHALKLGAKQIYMPTLDALAHRQTHGMAGGTGWQSSGAKVAGDAVTVLDDKGGLLAQAKEIVELVRDAGAILGTAHLGVQEIMPLARFCSQAGFERLLITHPYFDPPMLSIEAQKELAALGATLELCGGNLYPIPGTAKLDNYLESVEAVGPERLILTSDAGQARKSAPAEVLRIFAQCLMEKGVSQKDLDLMTKHNPKRLLGD